MLDHSRALAVGGPGFRPWWGVQLVGIVYGEDGNYAGCLLHWTSSGCVPTSQVSGQEDTRLEAPIIFFDKISVTVLLVGRGFHF